MDRNLSEIQALLVDFPVEQETLRRAIGLAADLRRSTDFGQLSSDAQEAVPRLLSRVAELLTPPALFSAPDEDLDANAKLSKDAFRQNAASLVELAQSLSEPLAVWPHPVEQDGITLRACLIVACGRFAHVALSNGVSTPDASARAHALSDRLLHQPTEVRLPVLRQLLQNSLPPFFKAHPKLNPSTGRVLSRPLGGDRGMMDWFEESEEDTTSWRKQAGLASVVKLVVDGLEPGEVEDLWPFLLPPLLAYLDDYEAANKLVGLSILESLLDKADASLLRRTGVGKMFEKSLENAFSSLSDPLSPSLLSAAHPIALKLVNLQSPPTVAAPGDDRPRFDALCTLLTVSVAHTWEFKSGHVALETVSSRALPALVAALGAGTIRYLQLLVPHLCSILTSANGTWTDETAGMFLAAAEALECVVRHTAARIGRWQGTVGAAVAQCYVELREDQAAVRLRKTERGQAVVEDLDKALRAIMAALRPHVQVAQTPSLERLFREPALHGLWSTTVPAQ